MARLTHRELEGATLHLLLVLVLRGRSYRFAALPLQVPRAGAEPTTLQFIGGLISPSEWTDEGAPAGEAVTSESVAVEVAFSTDTAAGWAAVVDADHDLGDATGELSIWREGDDFDAREVLVSGMVAGTSYGPVSASVSLTIVRDPVEDAIVLPPADATVDQTSWPTDATYQYDESIFGEQYSEVFGDPGLLTGSEGFSRLPGVPALLVRIDKVTEDNSVNPATFVLGNGPLACVGSTVILRNLTQSALAAFTPTPTVSVDGRGKQVTIATIPASGASTVVAGDEFWWSPTVDGEGGRIDFSPARKSVRDVGDLLRYLVGLSGSGEVDTTSIDEIAARLAGWRFDFYLNDGKSPRDLLLDDILPMLPVSFERGAFTYWDWAATVNDAVDAIDTSTRGGYLDGEVTRSDPRAVRNQFRIEYCLDPAENTYRRYLVLGPDWGDDATVQPHPYASASRSRYGLRVESSTIQSDMIRDPGTAYAVLDHLMRRQSMTHRSAAFVLPQPYQHLRKGAVVRVSHAPIAWDNKVCLVRSIVRAPGDTLVTVETCTDWIRDAT